jgi:DNA repair protein RecO (recombination protein O)
MPITLQPAFVLHHRPYRETSVILDLFTQDHGRIAAVAKGVRQSNSRLRALLQPFIPLFVSWQGKSELMSLTTAEPNGMPNRLKGESVLSGLYLNELLMRVLHKQDPHPALYTIYHQTLLELQQVQAPQKTLRLFEKKLLEELGYGLQLRYDVSTKRLICPESYYQFHVEHGFEVYLGSETHGQSVFLGQSLLALAAEQLEDEVSLRDAKRLMRLALMPLLGQRPLHTRRLYSKMQARHPE